MQKSKARINDHSNKYPFFNITIGDAIWIAAATVLLYLMMTFAYRGYISYYYIPVYYAELNFERMIQSNSISIGAVCILILSSILIFVFKPIHGERTPFNKFLSRYYLLSSITACMCYLSPFDLETKVFVFFVVVEGLAIFELVCSILVNWGSFIRLFKRSNMILVDINNREYLDYVIRSKSYLNYRRGIVPLVVDFRDGLFRCFTR